MIQIETTKHFYGITLSGDYQDLNRLYDSINRYLSLYMNKWGDYYPYHEYEYLLSLNYDIRHAFMGARRAKTVENNSKDFGVMAQNLFEISDEDKKAFGSIRNKHKNGNLYFSVEILYPLVFHYLIAFENILEEDLDETWFEQKPEEEEYWLSHYTLLDALSDQANIRQFTALLWCNIQSLLGEEKTKAIYDYYLDFGYSSPHSLYCDALLHWQLGNFEKLDNTGRKAFLELCIYEIIDTEDLNTNPSESKQSYDSYLSCMDILTKLQDLPAVPTKMDFYERLEKDIKPGTPLYENVFDEFLTRNYGISYDDEPEW